MVAPLPNRFKEWPYAGLTVTFIPALISHNASGTTPGDRIALLIMLTFFLVSYFSFREKININNK